MEVLVNYLWPGAFSTSSALATHVLSIQEMLSNPIVSALHVGQLVAVAVELVLATSLVALVLYAISTVHVVRRNILSPCWDALQARKSRVRQSSAEVEHAQLAKIRMEFRIKEMETYMDNDHKLLMSLESRLRAVERQERQERQDRADRHECREHPPRGVDAGGADPFYGYLQRPVSPVHERYAPRNRQSDSETTFNTRSSGSEMVPRRWSSGELSPRRGLPMPDGGPLDGLVVHQQRCGGKCHDFVQDRRPEKGAGEGPVECKFMREPRWCGGGKHHGELPVHGMHHQTVEESQITIPLPLSTTNSEQSSEYLPTPCSKETEKHNLQFSEQRHADLSARSSTSCRGRGRMIASHLQGAHISPRTEAPLEKQLEKASKKPSQATIDCRANSNGCGDTVPYLHPSRSPSPDPSVTAKCPLPEDPDMGPLQSAEFPDMTT